MFRKIREKTVYCGQTLPAAAVYCEVVPEGDAGLSVLGSALLMGRGVFNNLCFGSLPRRKAGITLKERYSIGKQSKSVPDVGCPAWTTTVTYIIAHL